MSKRITEKNQAFTMVELLAVLVILGIIMAITIPVVSHYISGNNKDYYEKLEATVVSSGQDFFNDYHANLPKEIGQVSKVDVNTLTDQKYITEILGTDKKSCEGSVITQKLANGKYSYTACLKCDKQSDGSYKYESSNRECGYNPDNNSKYVIKIDGLGENTTTQTAQAQSYTVPSAHVYVNDQPLAIELKPTPSSINTDILGINKIYYTYKSEVKELSVRVYDPKKPELANITATANGVNIGSGVYSNKDVQINISATDWTTATVYGSGINYFEYQLNGGTKEQLTPTTTDNKTFTLTKTFTSTGIYNISVKAVDKEGNVSDAKTFVVKIDKAKPTGTITVARNGGSYNSLNVKATLSSADNIDGSGVKQMCVQESSDVNTCSFETYAASKILTLSGTYDGIPRTIYAWYKDGVGNISDINSYTYTLYKKPTITTQITSSNIGTKSFDVSIGVTAIDKGLEKVVWYYKKNTDATYKTKETLNTTDVITEVILKETISSLTTGTYNVYGEIYDALGNKIKTNEISVTLKTIVTATGAIASPTSWTNQNVIVTLPTASGMTTQYSTNGSTWTNYNTTSKVTVSSNSNIYYRYNDGTNAGSYSSISIANIDKTKPTISSLTATPGNGSISITINATDSSSGISSYQYKLGSGNWQSSSNSTYEFTKISDGTYTIYVRVTDKAGNISDESSKNNIVVTTKYVVFSNNNQTDSMEFKTCSYGPQYWNVYDDYGWLCKAQFGSQVYFRTGSNSSTNSYISVGTKEALDLSKYTKMQITYSHTFRSVANSSTCDDDDEGPCEYYPVYFCYSLSSSTTTNSMHGSCGRTSNTFKVISGGSTDITTFSVSNVTKTIDISEFDRSEKQYIYFEIYEPHRQCSSEVTITNITLLP